MNKIFIYPGTFSPPTYGHLDVVKRAVEIFNEVVILCSINTKKEKPWFSPDECVQLWRSYNLPANVKVDTLKRYQERNIDPSRIVMIRGIRDQKDMEHEKDVMTLNRRDFGIKEFFYIFSNNDKEKISSSISRKMARDENWRELSQYVSGYVQHRLNQYIKGGKNGKLLRPNRIRSFNR